MSTQCFFGKKRWRYERRRREYRSAEGSEGAVVLEGVSPSPLGEESGEEAVPPLHKKNSFLELIIASFAAF